jgi:CP12 domain
MLKTLEPIQTEVTPTLEEAIQDALISARSTCELQGNTSSDCAVAWDIVEELQAERSHRRQVKEVKNALQSYCDEHPDADECRVYDV